MKRALLAWVVGYLACGLVFAARTMPDQTWTCPAPAEPHGTITYGGLAEPPREDCRPGVTATDRATWLALATAGWLPLVAAKGLSGD